MAATNCCYLCLEVSTPQQPLRAMKCGQHWCCSECFCRALERAIALEDNYPIPCGNTTCHHPSLQEVQAILTSFPTIQAGQRDDLLGRYANRLPEYNTPLLDRIYCSNQTCMITQGSSRFLDKITCSVGDGSRVRCPDCTTTTCVNCKGPWIGPKPGNHTCILAARDADDYIASLPEDQKWQWHKCGGCDIWVGKEDEESCNHMTCRCKHEFCLICGREWGRYFLCRHGCPKYGPAVYDDEDYNQFGYHRVTGRNRAGAFRALDALESDELMPDEEDTTEHGHIYAVPYLGRVVSPDLTLTIPRDIPSLRAALVDKKLWGLLGLYTLTNYGLVVFLHNRLAANGYVYNRWGMDEDGYDIRGYNFYGIDRQGRDRKGLDPADATETLGQQVEW